MARNLESDLLKGCKLVYKDIDFLAENVVERVTNGDAKREIRRAIAEIIFRIHSEIETPLLEAFPELNIDNGIENN